MAAFLNRSTCVMLVSAIALTALTFLPATRDFTVFRIIALGMHVGDTLFHEIGHSLFHCLFGQPAVPMIFTVFGADQAGGMSMTFGERSHLFQFISLAAFAYGCKWLHDGDSYLFIPACVFGLVITAVSFTTYTQLIVAFMGHGTSVAMGGFFLYRAIIYLDARGDTERWLNAFFGFYLIGFNFNFAYGLAFDAAVRSEYSNLTMFGAGHHDLVMMTEELPHLSVEGAAIFMMAYCIAVCAISIFVSYYHRNDYEY